MVAAMLRSHDHLHVMNLLSVTILFLDSFSCEISESCLKANFCSGIHKQECFLLLHPHH